MFQQQHPSHFPTRNSEDGHIGPNTPPVYGGHCPHRYGGGYGSLHSAPGVGDGSPPDDP